uniref:Uncharacterized protein n=1 Tax=Romanomermis culicivorax TaxID=13658 RepID=A0A915K705_ROMCU
MCPTGMKRLCQQISELTGHKLGQRTCCCISRRHGHNPCGHRIPIQGVVVIFWSVDGRIQIVFTFDQSRQLYAAENKPRVPRHKQRMNEIERSSILKLFHTFKHRFNLILSYLYNLTILKWKSLRDNETGKRQFLYQGRNGKL